jgi:hypothetical protein
VNPRLSVFSNCLGIKKKGGVKMQFVS